MATRTQITIIGHLVGPTWAGYQGHNQLEYDLTREQKRNVARRSLRDHVLSAINVGDFQHCEIANGLLRISMTRTGPANRVYDFTHWFDLDCFPSIADCLVQGDWSAPDFEDEP